MPEQIDNQLHAVDSPASDFALLRNARHYPLGFPMDLTTNSADVLKAAAESWQLFSSAFNETPVRICLRVHDGDARLPAPPKFQWHDHLMSIISDTGNFVICDFRSNFAFGWVTPAVAANHGFLRYYFLDAATLSLVEQSHLAPLHGAFIARQGRGVVLCGHSFAGKSTLAYACARAGWTLIADDGTFLVRDHADRYGIGNPHTIRLRNGARHLFPELAGRLSITLRNGKIGMEILTSELPISVATGCPIEHVVFLNRREAGSACLEHYPKDKALAWCEQFSVFGEPHVRAAISRSYRRLLGAGIWELSYRNLDDAIACLEELIQPGG